MPMSHWEIMSDNELAALSVDQLIEARAEATAAAIEINNQIGSKRAEVESEKRKMTPAEADWLRRARFAVSKKAVFITKLKPFFKKANDAETVTRLAFNSELLGLSVVPRKAFPILKDLVAALAGYEFDDEVKPLIVEANALIDLDKFQKSST